MDDLWAHIGQESSEDQEANQNVVVKLLDPSLFDCQLCHRPLTIPVFQCDRGDHIACSSCRTKHANRCPFVNGSVGFTRAPLLEKILRSITTSCPNKKYGCEESLAFSNRNEHGNDKCAHSPCSCPFPGCEFVSSAKQLYQHFSGDHPNAGAAQFEYNRRFKVTLNGDDKCLVLQEKNNRTLFILVSHVIEGLGNTVTLHCIQPGRFEGFCYDVIVKPKELDSLTFDSFTKSTPRHEEVVDGGPPELSFFLVPSYFFGSSGQLKVDLCIYCSTN